MKVFSNKGFTLIEIIVVIAIIATLTAISYASYVTINKKLQLKRFANQLSTDINFAKTKSRELGERIVFVIAKSGVGGQNWITGVNPLSYFAFVDKNKNFTFDTGTDDVAITGLSKPNIKIDNNTISNSCITNGKCFLIFPVGPPLIGASELTIDLKSTSTNYFYSVKVRAITGVAHVKKN